MHVRHTLTSYFHICRAELWDGVERNKCKPACADSRGYADWWDVRWYSGLGRL
jgi:hypothetical protein